MVEWGAPHFFVTAPPHCFRRDPSPSRSRSRSRSRRRRRLRRPVVVVPIHNTIFYNKRGVNGFRFDASFDPKPQ
jgi:fatty acid desaturase